MFGFGLATAKAAPSRCGIACSSRSINVERMAGFAPSPVDPLADAYAIVKEHAIVEGAFSEKLLRHWFDAAWALCAAQTGLIYPAQAVDEFVAPDPYTGVIRLSYPPSSAVEIYLG